MKSKRRSSCNSEITNWLDAAGRYPRLPVSVIHSLSRQIQQLPEDSPKRKKLVNKMVEHNLLLVANFVKRFMDSRSHNGWGSSETTDFLQIGTLGLIRAAEKFDPSMGYTFATYACFWMRSLIGRYNLKTITPVYVSESANRKMIYYKRNGKVFKQGSNSQYSGQEIMELQGLVLAAHQCVSLDIETRANGSMADMLEAPVQEHPLTFEAIFDSIRESGVNEVGLNVLKLTFVEKKTIKQISKILNLSEERVSNIRRFAIERASTRPELFAPQSLGTL
jgi:RNA polymerase primary sigma factor